MSVRVIFLGMRGAFSAIPLERLLNANTDVLAVVVPAPTGGSAPIRVLDLPTLDNADFTLQPATQRNVVQLARDHAIPVLELGDTRHPQTLSLLRALQPELLVIACFPFILPSSLLDMPVSGGWNLHPSLLPKLRGPSPLFWVFREGCCAGVTLHRMNARMDAGDIIAQMRLDFPDGMTYAEAEHACAQWGARLLVDALRALERGALHVQPQNERETTYRPSPSPEDFVIGEVWSARRAFNFVRGVKDFGHPVLARVGDRQVPVRNAIEYRLDPADGPQQHDDDETWLRCVDGWLRVSR